jgi:predicted MFS family arabinose efflux permease
MDEPALAPPTVPSNRQLNERTIVGLIGAVQFVNILDFMMVMPLGPDFAEGLGIPASQLGLIGGSYTAAAAVSGIAAAFFLDRFDRRSALALAMLGLVFGTAAGALATDMTTLVGARVVAGLFGGPATSVALSIIADVIPAERRGRAMGAVMGAFSAASVLGVPAGLELARIGGWRAPFIGVALLGFVVNILGYRLLPPLRLHLEGRRPGPPRHQTVQGLLHIFARPLALFAYAALGLSMMSAFSLIPNISAHLQQNLHYPREHLGVLYLVGGTVSFVSMRLTGRFVDKIGGARVNAAGVLAFAGITWLGFVMPYPPVPIVLIFAAFMVAQTTRNVALTTLLSRVPDPQERAGFMSVQSTVQHLAAAAGAILSSRILHDGPEGMILGVPGLALFAIVLALVTPPLVFLVERGVNRGAAGAPASAPITHG